MRRHSLAWLATIAALAGLGLVIKLHATERFVFADAARANAVVRSRLAEAGWAVQPPRFAGDWRVEGRRGSCVLLAGVAGDMGQDRALWERAAQPGDRLRYHYRGATRTTFPRWRVPIEDQGQRQLARMGIAVSRPAVVVTIARGDCGSEPELRDIGMPVRWAESPNGG